jgi:hypothetical protein
MPLSESEREICRMLNVDEAEYKKHRGSGPSERVSLHSARGTGKIGIAIDNARRFVDAAGKKDERVLLACALETRDGLSALLDAAGETREESAATMTVRNKSGHAMIEMPIRKS